MASPLLNNPGPWAIIDCGSHTFNLLVGDDSATPFRRIGGHMIPVGLQKGLTKEKSITPQTLTKVIQALQILKEKALNWQASSIHAVGTSAFRQLKDREQVLQIIYAETGLTIDVISGEQEAALIWKGVAASGGLKEGTGLVLDIGGGSTEAIWVDQCKAIRSWSLSCGAMAMVQKLRPSDPMSMQDLMNARAWLKGIWEPVWADFPEFAPTTLYGCSGFFNSLFDLEWYRLHPEQPSPNPIFWHYDTENFSFWHQHLLPLSIEEKSQLPGMPAFRAEMSGMAGLLTQYFLEKFPITDIRGIRFALKEGMMMHLIENQE
jgi:exopolyphosphatase/guanosine-5'-triphosphate,3'-diphosphate pyrophosphatase